MGKLKVLAITDTNKSAIFRLTNQIKKYSSEIEMKIVDFHPKKPDSKQIENFKNGVKWCDIIDVQYWKSGSKIKEMFPELWKSKKKILTHHNPYNLHEENWIEYKKIIVLNKTQQSQLPNSIWIPHCIDMNFFKFNENYSKEKIVNMTVARIEGKKGVYEVAKACAELGYKFLLVGRISKQDYYDKISKEFGQGNFEFRNNVTEDLLLKSYYESAIHVCNSVDNFESGTMPILEAISCGVPVVTRKIGHIPDIFNGENLSILDCQPENTEVIKNNIKDLMEDLPKRLEMRKKAIESISDRTPERFSKDYLKVYCSI